MTKQEQIDRDLRILRHVGQYRMSLACVIARVHFDHNENACKQVINRLIRDQRLVSRKGTWAGPRVYYQLTPTGAAYASVPKSWADPLGPDPLRESLQVLWWCCMTTGQRTRVESQRVADLLGRRPPRAIHCAIRRPTGGGTLYRMYLPAPETDKDEILKHCVRLAAAVARVPELLRAVQAKEYGVQVLVTSKRHQQVLYKRFQHAAQQGDDELWSHGVIPYVALTVGIEDLPAMAAQATKDNERRLHAKARSKPQ